MPDIPWGTVLTVALFALITLVLFYTRFKQSVDARLALRRFQRQQAGAAEHHTPHPAHDDGSHDAHDHGHEDSAFDMTANPSGPLKWVLVIGFIILAAIVIVIGFVSGDSPTPGSIAVIIKRMWLFVAIGMFCLLVATSALGRTGKPLRAALTWIAVALVVLGIFGTALDNTSSKHESGRSAAVKQTRPPTGEKMWVSFVAPSTGITWILAAEGHNTHICDPGVSPNCNPVDPAHQRYRKWCRIGTETFAWETGRCVMQDAVGVQSKTGADLPLGYTDVANDKVEGTIVPVAAPAPTENDDEVILAGGLDEE